MKKFTHIITIFFSVILGVTAQQEKGITGADNWLKNWTEFKPQREDYGEPNQILAGNISANTKLVKRNIYLLQGPVYLINNAVLTIEPGTVILCDATSKAALIVTKGSKLIADGLETDPIVFTSNKSTRKAGDWGGIVILGEAPINKFGNASSVNYDLNPFYTLYGGTNKESNSGILRYVRIEFAGTRTKSDGNFNSLLIAGVGNKTIIENIMVSFAGGNSFEINGGEVNLAKMVSYKSSNNDYHFNYGTQCNITNSLAIRSSFLSSKYGSRCLDIASYNKREEVDFTKKQTKVTATNLTLINNSENINQDIASGLVKEAIYVAENATIDCKRTVVSGFNPAVILDSKIEINDKNLSNIKFEQMYFNSCNGNIFVENNSNNEDLENWYGNSIFSNVYAKGDNKETFIDASNEKRPDFRLRIGKIIASSED